MPEYLPPIRAFDNLNPFGGKFTGRLNILAEQVHWLLKNKEGIESLLATPIPPWPTRQRELIYKPALITGVEDGDWPKWYRWKEGRGWLDT